MSKRKSTARKTHPPKNYFHFSVYLTPEQHAMATRRAKEESDRLSAQTGRSITGSVAQYIRTLIESDGLATRPQIPKPAQPVSDAPMTEAEMFSIRPEDAAPSALTQPAVKRTRKPKRTPLNQP